MLMSEVVASFHCSLISCVMTVAREVASRHHMIAKKPVTVRMMPKEPKVDGKNLHNVSFLPFSHLVAFLQHKVTY